jgi:hypothetical protein
VKFTHLSPGQRFRWRNQIFSKTGPLTAVAESDGRTQMIPRSAVTLPVDALIAEPQPGPALSPEQVTAALDEMTAALERLAGALEAESAAMLRTAIADGKARFRERIGL